MHKVTKMMAKEDDARFKVVDNYNIENHFRGYHGRMSALNAL